MKISEGIKIKGRPADIPDCTRNDLPEFFKEMGFTKGAEIGSYFGKYTEVLAKSGLQIYAIDPWRIYDDYGNPRGQKRLDFQYDSTKKLLEPYPNCTVIRKTSMEALDDFPDGSLDFVYIDGNHHFPFVAEDLFWWSTKVKKGGVISGHDYYYSEGIHVKQVVDAFVASFGIRNFWVLGKREDPVGPGRERWRSWMWFNKLK
jgi:hypothetical protein